ncbi:MAG TPA: transposase [Candidatus Methylacidiphilales bacterium]|jgi:REP element-mobilizing transposase RayT|nr:transposase [Candidatus Methylacidiphilales bacterium]
MTPRKRLNHEAPYWVTSEADYFATICAVPRRKNLFCHPDLGKAVLDAAKLYNEKHVWWCHLIMLMPDHIHMLVCFPPDKVMSQAVGLGKRGLARQHKISWQRNYFDHCIRNEENDFYKSEYILHNPVRAGLVEKWEDWPYFWMPGLT